MNRLAIDRIKQIFGAEYANVQPHSGAQANMAVFMACMNPGDKFLGLNLSHGGHLSHGSPVNFSGLMFQALEYGVKEDTGYVDYDMMEEVALRERPKMIIGGASAYTREWDYARMRKIADEIGAILLIDMAHPAGLIAAGLLDNIIEICSYRYFNNAQDSLGAHVVVLFSLARTLKTHGVKKHQRELLRFCLLLDSAVFPGVQGGPFEHVILSLLLWRNIQILLIKNTLSKFKRTQR